MKRERVEELFYIRAICAFGIFMIHLSGAFAVTSSYGSRTMYLGVFLNQFFRFGTPVFMMISGFVLFYNYRTPEEFHWKGFYIKKIKYILVPFLTWSLFYYLVLPYILAPHSPYVMQRYEGLLSLDSMAIQGLLKTIILGNAYPHLYFIFLIFQFYLLYPIFMRCFIKFMEKSPFIFFLICLFGQGLVLIYAYSYRGRIDHTLFKLFDAYYLRSVFAWFYYFLIGGLLALHYPRVIDFIEKNMKKVMPFYLISTALYVGEVYYNIWQNKGRDFYGKFGSIRPSTMIYATITMPVLIWIGRKIHRGGRYKQIVRAFGIYSLGIYFAHPFILELIKTKIINKYSSILGYSRVSTLVFLIIVGFTCTFSFVLLGSRLKCGSLILGKVPVFKGWGLKERREKVES